MRARGTGRPAKGFAFCRPPPAAGGGTAGLRPAGRAAGPPAPSANSCPYYIPQTGILQSVSGGSPADDSYCGGAPFPAALSSTASTSRMPSSGDCPFCSFTVR